MKVFVVALFLVACASAGVLNSSRPTIITLLDYYKNNKDETRIINGKPATPTQFPWQVSLRITVSGGAILCGGSLISSRWVVTAAHCVVGGIEWRVKIGGINRNAANEPGSVIIFSRTAMAHESYDSTWLYNDIALIKLDSDVEFSDTIQAIRLPSRSEVGDRLEDRQVTVSGYGKTSDAAGSAASETLNFVQLTTITNDLCASYYGPSIIDSTICCRGNPNHSTCNGDSGGPLVIYREDGQPTLIGVVSFVSNSGCDTGIPSGYVRTASYLDWISDKTGIQIRD